MGNVAEQSEPVDGVNWTTSVITPPPLVLFQAGPMVVGALDEMLRLAWWDGSTWSSPSLPAPAQLSALWADAPNDVWAGGPNGTVASWNGNSWTRQLPRALASDAVEHISGTSADDVWAAAGGTLLHFDGARWAVALSPDAVGGAIRDVWANSPGDVWVLGADTRVHRWDGANWRSEEIPQRGARSPELIAISGAAADDVWILRGADTVLHWDGQNWSTFDSDNAPITAVWASGAGEAWVAGNGLSRLRSGITYVNGWPGLGTVSAVAGSSTNDVWALVGTAVLHYDGRTWRTVATNDHRFTAVSARNGGGLIVADDVGGHSRLFQMGNDQSFVTSAGPTIANAVWIAPDGTSWLGGAAGALLRHRPAVQ